MCREILITREILRNLRVILINSRTKTLICIEPVKLSGSGEEHNSCVERFYDRVVRVVSV